VISEMHRQQSILLNTTTRSFPDSIVNLVQRQVRSIVRGKARAAVELGAMISISVRNGFAFLHRISWDPYNKHVDLIPQAKNRNFCTRNNIRLSGKRLGWSPKDPEINTYHKQQLSADQRRRYEVEGCFGSGNLKYYLDLTMPRLAIGAETSIAKAFVGMHVEKILMLVHLYFVIIFALFYSW